MYLHRDNSGVVFYVGKGCGDRAWSMAGRGGEWKHRAARGFSVCLARADMNESCALSLESAIIAAIGLDNLSNKRRGGRSNSGWTHSEDARRKIAEAGRGRVMSAEQARALGDRFRGKKLSEDHKGKLSAAKLGRPGPKMSEETRRRISAAHTGRKHPEWVRQKMKESSPRLSGNLSPSYDHKIRSFTHQDGRDFIGTRGEFIRQFSIHSSCASSLINGKKKSAKGWMIKND